MVYFSPVQESGGFKFEDGTLVYFQDGSLVPPEIIIPDEIPDDLPGFGELQNFEDQLSALNQNALHLAQAQNDSRREDIDVAREKIDTAR
jgi:hypothetical protein